MRDITTFWRLGTLDNNNLDGIISFSQFDGTEYREDKNIDITLNEAIEKKLFIKDSYNMDNLNYESHSGIDKLTWSRKDDDKYRNLIK
jgi:hypothetical protein